MSNVHDFGAASDGTTDDTAALEHAIADGDGTLVLPRGSYLVTRTIEVPLGRVGPLAIDGSGGGARIVMAGAGPALRLVGTHDKTADPAGFRPIVLQKERMPTVHGLSVEGRHAEADGIELVGTMQATLDGVHLLKLRHGILLRKRNRNVLIANTHIYHGTGVGVYLDRVNLHQINITGCHISYNRLGGIRIEGSEVRNLQITGNDIEYNNAKSHDGQDQPTAEILVDVMAPGASVEEVTVASNTIQATVSPGGANLRILDKPGEGRRPGLWTVTGNIIGSQENNVHLVGCYGVTLTGNVIYSCGHRNVLVERSQQIVLSGNVCRRHTDAMYTGLRLVDSTDVVINGCQVYDESPEGQTSGASLLELAGCQRVTVSGSQFIGGVPYGIDLADGSDVSITGCTVLDDRERPQAAAMLRWSGKGNGNLLSGNRLGRGTKGSLIVDESAGVAEQGNLTN